MVIIIEDFKVYMIFLGIGLFLFPYFAGYLIISRIKPMRRFFIYASTLLAVFICFIIIFFAQDSRTFADLANKLIQPTIKFYTQYYGLSIFFITVFIIEFFCMYKIKKTIFYHSLSRIFFIISILLTIFNFTSTQWAVKYFPLNQPRTVFFVLSSPLEGSINTSIIVSALLYIFIPMLGGITGCIILIMKIKIFKYPYSNYILILTFTVYIISIFSFCIKTKIYEYPELIWQALQKPEASEFYQNEYIYPDSVTIQFPEKKRNCIFILLESMESSFADYQSGGLLEENLIPHLTQLASENINFSGTDLLGGGIDLDGTGWTIAAMFAKLAGLPFNPTVMEPNPSGIMSFFPNAVTLTDILTQYGYTQRFLFGSEKKFASRDVLLETHGGVEIHDINWYKAQELLPLDYDNHFWGFEDEKLYAYARTEIEALAETDTPFFLGLLTVDTHMPEGYICNQCTIEHPDSPIQDAISCADRQLADFITWCQSQPFYENTVIVILGDHLFMTTESSNLFSDKYITTTSDSARRWINIFINPAIEPLETKNRLFSSFDMFPTILESMGVTIDSHALGFGRSLFSNTPTLLEKYPISYINTELMKKSIEYMNFLY